MSKDYGQRDVPFSRQDSITVLGKFPWAIRQVTKLDVKEIFCSQADQVFGLAGPDVKVECIEADSQSWMIDLGYK